MMLRSVCLALPALLLGCVLSGCGAGEQPTAATAIQPAPAAATAPAETASAPAAIVPAAIRSQAVIPGRPSRVFILAALGDACEPAVFTDLKVSVPPAKGEVSFSPGQKTKIAASGTGACLGMSATGTGIYYTARPGEKGPDQFTVAAILPTGETATRSFTVEIAE